MLCAPIAAAGLSGTSLVRGAKHRWAQIYRLPQKGSPLLSAVPIPRLHAADTPQMGRWLELLGHSRVPTGLAAAAKGRAASLCNLASAGRSGSCSAAVFFKKMVTFLQGLRMHTCTSVECVFTAVAGEISNRAPTRQFRRIIRAA